MNSRNWNRLDAEDKERHRRTYAARRDAFLRAVERKMLDHFGRRVTPRPWGACGVHFQIDRIGQDEDGDPVYEYTFRVGVKEWGSTATGVLQVEFGSGYGYMKHMRSKKDGSIDIDVIVRAAADGLESYHQGKKARARRQTEKAKAEQVVKAAGVQTEEYWTNSVHFNVTDAGLIDVRFSLPNTIHPSDLILLVGTIKNLQGNTEGGGDGEDDGEAV
jgi:hypothetical protein